MKEKNSKMKGTGNDGEKKLLAGAQENKRIIIALVVFSALFILLVVYLTYFQVFKAEKVADHNYNPRLWVDENLVTRGSIFDKDGNVLAYTKRDEDGNNYRVYEHGELYAHVIGYSSKQYGKTGLEKNYNSLLLNINDRTPLSELRDIIIKNDEGNDLALTLDTKLQSLAYELLDGRKGSIVLMNPQTGEVYVMVSRPTFNPNSLERDWNTLVEDTSGILMNRATQGLYAPGSIFKIITGTALLEREEKIDLDYDDKGTTTIDGHEFKNVNANVYGKIGLEKALVYSSNVYFADKSIELGAEFMGEVSERFMLNKQIPFDIATSISKSPFKSDMGKTYLAAASFGQGDLLVTPLNMAMMVSAIANEGKMMKPFLVKQIISPEGNIITSTSSIGLSTVCTPNIAATLKDYLVAAVDNDSKAQIDGVRVGGKTGTAENSSGKTHAWFVGFAPAQNPQVAVAVILEEDGTSGGDTAAPIAGRMMEAALKE